MHKAKKENTFLHPSLVWRPYSGNPSEFLDEKSRKN